MTVTCPARFVFLTSIWLVFMPEAFAQSAPQQQRASLKPALPEQIAEDVTVDLVETLFLFDRLFTKSRTVTSADYLERVSEPSSRFYPDYLEYKRHRISKAEIVRRLPHVAMLGDSLSQNFYISSLPSMLWRARTERRKNWFLDTDSAPDCDWARKLSPAEREHPQTRMQEIATQFGEDYTQAIRPLIDRARSENHKVAFVVFGLADFETFFICRHQAEALHRRDPNIYPYYDVTCQRFESFKPPYQKDTTRFSLMLNAALRKMVANFNQELKDYPNVRLQYSNAFSNIKIRLEILHPKDAWHLSRTGHKVIAQTAFTALSPSLHFLGIGSLTYTSRRSHFRQ